jgi:hypothetical protein
MIGPDSLYYTLPKGFAEVENALPYINLSQLIQSQGQVS